MIKRIGVAVDVADEFFLCVFVQVIAEDAEHNHQDSRKTFAKSHGEGDGVVDAMGDDGCGENHDAVVGAALHKIVHRIVVSHEDTEGIVARNGEQGTGNAYGKPFTAVGEEIHHILNGSEAKAHIYGIDDTVEMLVKKSVVTKNQP